MPRPRGQARRANSLPRAAYVAIAVALGKGSLACQAALELLDWRGEGGSIFMRKAGVRPDLSVGEGLAGAARGILHEARDALEDRARPEAAAVHEYRKDMKRWRALLRLLAPFLGAEGDGLQREARDAQAALDALADLGKAEPGLPAGMAKALRSRIEKIKASETMALDETYAKSSAARSTRPSLPPSTGRSRASALPSSRRRLRPATAALARRCRRIFPPRARRRSTSCASA
jgi:hypothetical protein